MVNDDQIRLGAPGEMRNHEVIQGQWEDEFMKLIDETSRLELTKILDASERCIGFLEI